MSVKSYMVGPAVRGGARELAKSAPWTAEGPITDLAAWLGLGEDDTSKVALRILFHEVGFVRKMVELRARTVASIPWEITRGDRPVFTSEDEPPEELAYLAGLDDIAFRQSVSIMMTGASYERILRSGQGIDRFQYMIPDTIHPHFEKDGAVAHFERRIKSRKEILETDTVLYCWPFDPWVEAGPVKPAAEGMRTSASVVRAMSQFAEKYLRKGALKNTIFNVPQGMDPAEQTRLKKLFDNLWSGVRGVGEALVLEAGSVEATVIGDGLSDLGNMTLTESEMKQIADAFGVPRSIALDDAANFATAGRSYLTFLGSVVLPDRRKLVGVWNNQVLGPLGLTMRLHPERMEAFQTAKLEQAKAVFVLVGRPIFTLNEGRALVEMGEVAGGNDLFVPTTAPQPQKMLELPQNGTAAKIEELDVRVCQLTEQQQKLINPPVNTSPPLNDASKREIHAWRRKLKARGPGTEFECYHIPEEIERVVRARIRAGADLDVVFEEPYLQ